MNKKIISAILLTLMPLYCLMTSSCDGIDGNTWDKTKIVDGLTVPDFSTDKKVEFTAYGVPKYNESTCDYVFGKLKEAEFNKIIPLFDGRDGQSMGNVKLRYQSYIENSSSDNKTRLLKAVATNAKTVNEQNIPAIKKAKEYGLDTIVINEGIYDGMSIFSSLSEDDFCEVEQKYIDSLKDYKKVDGYAGFFLSDEPKGEPKIRKLGNICKYFKESNQKGYPLLNLLPIVKDGYDYADYNAYIDMYWKYCYEYLNYVSFDLYPIRPTGIQWWHLMDMEICANHLKESNDGGTLKTFIDCPSRDAWDNTVGLKNTDFLRFKIYSALAYGAAEIEYYELSYEGDTENVTNYIFNYTNPTYVTDAYNYVKEVNNEVRTFDSIYRNFNYDTTIIEGTCNSFYGLMNDVEEYNSLKSISEKNNNPTVCGCFNDGKNDAFMVVNYQNPNEEVKDSEITMNFDQSYDHVLVYQEGKENVYKTKKGSFIFEIKGTGGVFVIPLDL